MSDVVMLEGDTPPARQSRRRLVRAIVGLLGLLVISGGVVALAWFRTYQPLIYGNGWNLPGAKTIETLGLGTEYQFQSAPAETFQVWVQIKNTGPRGVTIEDVIRERHYYWRLKDVGVGIFGSDPHGNFGNEFRPFTPQRVDPGEYLQLGLLYEFANCEMGGTTSGFSSFQVRYSSTLNDQVAVIDFPFSVAIENTGGNCGDEAFLPS